LEKNKVAFKDYSKGFENELTSGPDGSSELRSEKTISLYPGSNSAPDQFGGDKIVWIRDGAKLVFEGRYPDDFEAKLYADVLTEDREIVFQDASGTIALIDDVDNSLLDAKNYTDQALANATVSYTNSTPMPESLGGYAVGTTFNNVSIENILTGLLYPYQEPAFSSFYIDGQTTILEVGDSIPAGNATFKWTTTNPTNVSPNMITISDSTAGVLLLQDLENDGSETIALPSSITKTSPASNTWTILTENTQNQNFSRNFSVLWRWRTYYGTSQSPTLDENGVKGLINSTLENNFSGNKTFAANDYKYIAYPTSFGLKTSFKDTATGFGVAMEPAITLSITNQFGSETTYYVHRTTNTIVGAITIGVS
jgi:hypothetical protein